MSLDIEQYGTIAMVENVFHKMYMMTMNAVNPPTDTPQSLMGMNITKMPMRSSTPPENMYGLRLPNRPLVLSEMKPMIGSVMASQNFATSMIVEAIAISMPIVVMYFNMTQDISATPPPSINAPQPYASFSLVGT